MNENGHETKRGWASIVISFFALLISALSAYYAYDQSQTAKRLSFQHINPKIKIDLEYPTKVKNSKLEVNYNNPEYIITNTGPISITSLTLDYRCFLYNKPLDKITSVIYMSGPHYEHILFKKKLEPSDSVKEQLPGFQEHVPNTYIGAFVFNAKYYRSSDLEEYDRREIFFIQDNQIHRHADFISSPYYGAIMKAISPEGVAQLKGEEEKYKAMAGQWWKIEK